MAEQPRVVDAGQPVRRTGSVRGGTPVPNRRKGIRSPSPFSENKNDTVRRSSQSPMSRRLGTPGPRGRSPFDRGGIQERSDSRSRPTSNALAARLSLRSKSPFSSRTNQTSNDDAEDALKTYSRSNTGSSAS